LIYEDINETYIDMINNLNIKKLFNLIGNKSDERKKHIKKYRNQAKKMDESLTKMQLCNFCNFCAIILQFVQFFFKISIIMFFFNFYNFLQFYVIFSK
jgi:hypothetical protein